MANISFHLLRFIVLLSKQTHGLYPKLEGLYIERIAESAGAGTTIAEKLAIDLGIKKCSTAHPNDHFSKAQA